MFVTFFFFLYFFFLFFFFCSPLSASLSEWITSSSQGIPRCFSGLSHPKKILGILCVNDRNFLLKRISSSRKNKRIRYNCLKKREKRTQRKKKRNLVGNGKFFVFLFLLQASSMFEESQRKMF